MRNEVRALLYGDIESPSWCGHSVKDTLYPPRPDTLDEMSTMSSITDPPWSNVGHMLGKCRAILLDRNSGASENQDEYGDDQKLRGIPGLSFEPRENIVRQDICCDAQEGGAKHA